MISSTDIAIFALLAIGSGRVAYSLTRDDIFRKLREWIWLRSAPEEGTILERGGEGDAQRPARMYHPHGLNADGDHVLVTGARGDLIDVRYRFNPNIAMRYPGFLGQLFECPYCMSFWTSLAACAAWLLLGDDVIYPAALLALWGVSNSFAVKGL